MEREVMWALEDGPGMEHAIVAWDAKEVRADGIMIYRHQGSTIRVRYELRCDSRWRVRDLHVTELRAGGGTLQLLADGSGHWSSGHGIFLPDLDGCTDVDLWGVAFTNTVPIRRLELQPGAVAEIDVAYVRLPALQVSKERQRYTCLERRRDGATYRYEGIASGFTAEIVVDADGLVMRYPGVAERLWDSQTNEP